MAATLDYYKDGVTGVDLGAAGGFQYALEVRQAIDGKSYGEVYRRGAWQVGTYGGWRWEASAPHILRSPAIYPQEIRDALATVLSPVTV